MRQDLSARAYIQLLNARIGHCKSILPEDRAIPTKSDSKQRVWILRRGGIGKEDPLFDDELAQQPLILLKGGRIEFYLRLRLLARKQHQVEIASYRVAFFGLPNNSNHIRSFRYDQSEGQPRDEGWDDDIGDNPMHPWAHLHVNFAENSHSNDFRLPTGPICPILLMCAFDRWYCSNFVS